MNGMKIVVIAAVAVIPIGGFVRWQIKNEHRLAERKRIGILDPERDRDEYERKQRITREVAERAEAEDRRLKEKIDQAQAVVDECRRIGDPGRVTLRGKVLLWDLTENRAGGGKRSPAAAQLADYMLAKGTDTDVTVVLVVEKHNVETVTYEFDQVRPRGSRSAPGYRVDMDIALVHLPKGEALGFLQVQGAPPPLSILRLGSDCSPEYGDTIGPLADWVKRQRRIVRLIDDRKREDKR